eukprot:CAMPEP_0198724700 /NCGR_PEP_ID=MMETSP1475-20131203/2139_1 /TAXON_ID= ORGANISM="Unidentified sp., Strain CCMP1999" /NCGR_SAMPLE_ID=MMETSP1475 /ASSEMBLY_ACC=CAM_ASM_001111 /LENGTH=318 /DNA_ID=CAMNT_0044486305 /DNA_START=2055 /DNA_END=3011 /DNA_ORIENTATION=+
MNDSDVPPQVTPSSKTRPALAGVSVQLLYLHARGGAGVGRKTARASTQARVGKTAHTREGWNIGTETRRKCLHALALQEQRLKCGPALWLDAQLYLTMDGDGRGLFESVLRRSVVHVVAQSLVAQQLAQKVDNTMLPSLRAIVCESGKVLAAPLACLLGACAQLLADAAEFAVSLLPCHLTERDLLRRALWERCDDVYMISCSLEQMRHHDDHVRREEDCAHITWHALSVLQHKSLVHNLAEVKHGRYYVRSERRIPKCRGPALLHWHQKLVHVGDNFIRHGITFYHRARRCPAQVRDVERYLAFFLEHEPCALLGLH